MYFKRFKQQNSLLQVDDNFATLLEIHNSKNADELDVIEELVFNFSFKVSQLEALNQNALSVSITVKKPDYNSLPKIIPASRKGIGFFNSREIIGNILTNRFDVLNFNKINQNLVITEKTADITSKINNQIVTAKKLEKNASDLSNLGIKKSKITLKRKGSKEIKGNFSEPLKASNNIDSNSSTIENAADDKMMRLKLMENSFISPSSVADVPDRTLDLTSLIQGTLKKSNSNQTNLLKELNSFYLSANQSTQVSDDYEAVYEEYYDDTVSINTPVRIKDISKIDSHLIVQFQLLKTAVNKDGKRETFTVESIEKLFDIQRYTNSFFLSKPPQVTITKNQTRNIIGVVLPGDKVSQNTQIKIYKKDLDDDFLEGYSLINDESSLDSVEQIKNYLYINDDKSTIYRIVVGNSNEFSDVMTKTPRRKKSNKIILVPTLQPQGLKLTVYGTQKFANLVSIRKLIRDVTIKEKQFKIVDGLSNPELQQGSKLDSTYITGLTPYHVYEVKARLIFSNGIEVDSSYSSFIEYIPYAGDLLNITVTETPIQFTDGVPEVQFTVSATLLEDQIGLLKRLLQQVSATYDEESLSKRNAPLDKFVAFNIVRYDLTTGEVRNMGIIANNDVFIDSDRSKLYNTELLRTSHDYKYVINPLIRDPNTITETKVELKDEETKKPYVSNFRKSRHPWALIKGSSVSTTFLDNDPKNDMLYGMIGTSHEVNVSFSAVNAIAVTNFLSTTLDSNKILLNWNIKGDSTLLDHFLIMREVNGATNIIGKSHCFKNNLSFVYEKTSNDIGRIRFLLIPIFQDYSSSNPIYSNYLLIEN